MDYGLSFLACALSVFLVELIVAHEKPLTYLATDYRGRPFMLGGPPPWGLLEERCTEALCETEHP